MSTYNKIKKNSDKVERDLTKERNDRCVPVAKKVLKLIGEFNGSVLIEDRMKFVKEYDELVMKVLEVIKESGIPVAEWGYVSQLAFVPLDHVKNYVSETINLNLSEVLSHMWGKDEMAVTLEDIALKKRSMVS